MSTQIYTLKILNTDVRLEDGEAKELVVRYHGKGDPAEIHHALESGDLEGILKGCEAVARKIFQDEFRFNREVDLNFTLEDENGIKIWHTKPSLYVKYPLNMTMNWTCSHLSQIYKTMTTLGVVELPSEVPLEGNALGARETAKVVMDSMASGVEFMGNVMLMRNTVDHNALAAAHS